MPPMQHHHHSSVPPPSSSSGATSVASPSSRPAHSLPPSQQNGHMSPYSGGSHGVSPHMRNGHQAPQGYIPPQQGTGMPPHEQPLPPQMSHPGYGMSNGYPAYPAHPQAPYMNGMQPPPR